MRGTSIGVLVALVVLGAPGRAVADAAVATNWISEVTSVEPPTTTFDVRVTGGDAFLEIAVQPGHTVQVLGPGDAAEERTRAFLRIERDGNVLADVRAPHYHRSLDRYGRTPVPAEASAEAEPRWDIVGRGGAHAWHDHRIHRIDPGALPPGRLGEAQVVERWAVPLVVDGEDVTVHGRLLWLPSAPWWPSVLVALVLTGVVIDARRRIGRSAATIAALVAAVLVVTVAAGELAAVTETAGPSPVGVATTALAVLLAIMAIALDDRRPGEAERLSFLAAATAVVFAATRASDALLPYVPSDVPVAAARYGLAAAAGLGAGVVLAFVVRRRGARSGSTVT